MEEEKFFKMKIGSKLQVWNGTARRTSGGLKKSDLLKNVRGRIVSRKQMEAGKKAFQKNKDKLRKPFTSSDKTEKEDSGIL